MRVRVCLFALLREILGTNRMDVEMPEGSTVQDVFDHIFSDTTLPTLRAPMLYAVNETYQAGDFVLKSGDEVVFIPPVSGGAPTEEQKFFVEIGPDPISLDPLIKAVEGENKGAIVTFQGTVRNHAEGRQVRGLTYEAYIPMARSQMAAVAKEIHDRFELLDVAMVHRVGSLELGEIAVAIAVSAPHRGDAFEACRYAIDRLKETVPIWKKEFYTDEKPIWK